MPELKADDTILLVDDFTTMRRIIRILLTKNGFENVIEADDGHSALERLKTGEVRLVIADLTMPRMSGAELLATVRENEQWSSLPFLLMMTEQERTDGGDHYADAQTGVIVKPFTKEILAQRISTLYA
ncbi:MAG TPA: response regulator [bacterium]|nr:response regulator [bacterium]